ncbi:MAG: hypothetical protein JO265_00655 [Acidimicrobiia bacterium]|nr:hypothetical protein [Acidimicrobiia bacterium]
MSDATGELYRQARLRIESLTADEPLDTLASVVPACPAWTVRDVIGHVVGVAEDLFAGHVGRFGDDQTAGQVGRHRSQDVGQLLEHWADTARPWEMGSAVSPAPPLLDLITHEHDIRGALGRPGARDDPAVRIVSDRLLRFEPPVAVRIEVEDAAVRLGPSGVDPIVLRTTRWEVLRWRMGRRSRRQLAAMDWSRDPEAALLDDLVFLGPAEADLVE